MSISAVKAKAFFIHQAVEQAQREDAPLDALEVKMLAFTETASDASPDMMAAAAEFEASRDSDAYEEKIEQLLVRAFHQAQENAKSQGQDARDEWRAAYDALRQEDHYILVMINSALAPLLRKKLLGLF